MDGQLSLHFFKWLMRPHDITAPKMDPRFRESFQFSELMTGSSSKYDPENGNPTFEYGAGMQTSSWNDDDYIWINKQSDHWREYEATQPYSNWQESSTYDMDGSVDLSSSNHQQLFGWHPKPRVRTVPYIPNFFRTCFRDDATKSSDPATRFRFWSQSEKFGFQKMVAISGLDQYPYNDIYHNWMWNHKSWFSWKRDTSKEEWDRSQNVFGMCYNEIQAGLYEFERYQKRDKDSSDSSTGGNYLGNVRNMLGDFMNSRKIWHRTESFWKDFVSLRNLKFAEEICPCQSEVPMYRKKRDPSDPGISDVVDWSEPGLGFGGAIFAAYGLYERRKKWDSFVDGVLGSGVKTFKSLRNGQLISWEELLYEELKQNDFSCWIEKKNNDERCDFYDPDIYTRKGKIKEAAVCETYCNDYAMQGALKYSDPKLAKKQETYKIMKKLMGSNLKINQSDTTQTDPHVNLAPCIQGHLDHPSNTMQVTFNRGSFIPDPTEKFDSIWEESTNGDTGSTMHENAARTFLRSFMGSKPQNYIEGICRKGGNLPHFVTKPSFWADVESNPRKVIVPCKDPDEPGCEDLLKEIDFDDASGNYQKTPNNADGSVTYQIKNSANVQSKICTYEVSLEDTDDNVAECDHECTETSDDQNDCSPHAEESAERCYFKNSYEKSLLRRSKSTKKNDELVQCQRCQTYDYKDNVLDGAKLQHTCLGRGIYRKVETSSGTYQYHPASYEMDDQSVKDYITQTENYVQNDLRQEIDTLTSELKKSTFRITNDVRVTGGDTHKTMPSIEAEMKTHAATDFLYIFLNMFQNDFGRAADREQISKGVETWAQKSMILPMKSADLRCRSTMQNVAFQDVTRPMQNSRKNILTDFNWMLSGSFGVSVESALNYNQCKQNVQGKQSMKYGTL